MTWIGARARMGLVLLAAVAAGGCTASNYIKAAQEIRPKNPHAACEYLAQALKADPQNPEAIALLKDIAQNIAEEHATRVADLERAQKYGDAVAQCDRVIATRKLVADLPGGVDVFVNADIRTKLTKKASEKYLADGKNFQANGDPKKAAQFFCLSKGFDPSNAEAARLYQESRSAATLHVAIALFASPSRHGQSIANDVTRRFTDKLVGKKPQFLAISREGEGQAQATLVGAIGCKYEDTGWLEKPDHRSEKRTRPRVDASGNPVVDAQGNGLYEEYRTEVRWVVHERQTALDMTLGYQVKLADGTIKWAKEYSDHAADGRRWVNEVHGDRSILPSEVADLPHEPQVPREFADLAGVIVDNLVEKLAHDLYMQQKK